ncbi:hypothetical protein [Bradyrhizobium sp. Ai1a-2]|nr:hypothetical protein [Bradyrhizobium sp. Ai1a-2]
MDQPAGRTFDMVVVCQRIEILQPSQLYDAPLHLEGMQYNT